MNGTLNVLQIRIGNAWKTVACGTSNGFTSTTAEIDGNSKCSGNYDSSEPGRTSWTMDFSGKAAPVDDTDAALASFNQLAGLQKGGQTFPIRQFNASNPTDVLRGNAFITSLTKTYPDSDSVTFDASFKGVGEFFFTPEA